MITIPSNLHDRPDPKLLGEPISIKTIKSKAMQRPPGYLEEVLAAASTIDGDTAYFDPKVIAGLRAKYGSADKYPVEAQPAPSVSVEIKPPTALPKTAQPAWWDLWILVRNPEATEFPSLAVKAAHDALHAELASLASNCSQCEKNSIYRKYQAVVSKLIQAPPLQTAKYPS